MRSGAEESSYPVAPKLLQELTSLDTVCFTGLDLTWACAAQNNCLIKCFSVLTSQRHNRKIRRLVLTGVSIGTIFDAESFCKKFVNKLMQIEQLEIARCQPMFIDKFFLSVNGAMSNLLDSDLPVGISTTGRPPRMNFNQRSMSYNKAVPQSQSSCRDAASMMPLASLKLFSISGINLEQIETALQRFLEHRTTLKWLFLDCQQEPFKNPSDRVSGYPDTDENGQPGGSR